MINTDQRSAKYLRDDANPTECYRCGDEPEHIHHTSYFPESTVPLCESCHGRVHTSDGDPHLQPNRARPGNYDKIRRRQERRNIDPNPDELTPRKIDSGKKRACADCGEKHVAGCMYPYRADYRELDWGVQGVFSERGVEWYCFRCAGDLPPLSHVR